MRVLRLLQIRLIFALALLVLSLLLPFQSCAEVGGWVIKTQGFDTNHTVFLATEVTISLQDSYMGDFIVSTFGMWKCHCPEHENARVRWSAPISAVEIWSPDGKISILVQPNG